MVARTDGSRRVVLRSAIAALLLCASALASAADWAAFGEPGAVAIMRHALAPGTGDPANLTLDDCATQRNLDARGRAQARAIGSALRENGVAFDAVLSSQWCRARDTAVLLGLGPVTDAPALNSFFNDFSTRDAQTAALREIIEQAPGPLMLVTHQVNISALTGVGTRSGEVLIVRLTPTGTELLGRVMLSP
ncbi:MAG: histidine phosphatase family protein [Pseudomonadota bacterium]